MDAKKTGILAILGASLMWAVEPVFAKLAYANSDHLKTSAIRAIVVALVALLYVLFTGVNGGVKVYHLAEQKYTTGSLYSRDRPGCQYSILTSSFLPPG
jgi:uncharacterized membrane protein